MRGFWSNVDKDGPPPEYRPDLGPCWLWTGFVDDGYGRYGNRPGVTRLAHRLAYLELVGGLAEDVPLDHLCRVRHCVNPTHLEPVTHAENVARGERASRVACRRGHPYDEGNTYRRPNGTRICRACKRASYQMNR